MEQAPKPEAEPKVAPTQELQREGNLFKAALQRFAEFFTGEKSSKKTAASLKPPPPRVLGDRSEPTSTGDSSPSLTAGGMAGAAIIAGSLPYSHGAERDGNDDDQPEAREVSSDDYIKSDLVGGKSFETKGPFAYMAPVPDWDQDPNEGYDADSENGDDGDSGGDGDGGGDGD